LQFKPLRIVVDERERPSGVPEALKKLGAQTEFKMLEVGDYIVSPSLAVERKSSRDFLKSLYSGRLFDQASRMSDCYEKSILIVEGNFPNFLYEMKNPKVFWGALTTLAFKFDLNVFFTGEPQQTAELIYTIAKHESTRKPAGPYVKKRVKAESLEQIQLLIVSSLPGIGPKLGERLLKRFGTIRRVFNASIAELASVEGIGRAKAERVAKILDFYYRSLAAKPQQLPLNESEHTFP